MDAAWVRRGGLAFLGTVNHAPVHAVVADSVKDADVLALANEYRRQFPNRVIVAAGTVAEARSEVRRQLALLGGTTPAVWYIRGLLTEETGERTWAEFIRELGRPQVSIVSRQQFHSIAQQAGIESLVEALSAGRVVTRSA